MVYLVKFILNDFYRYANVIMLVPVIQFSSMFVLTSEIIKYYADQSLQTLSISFIQLDKGSMFLL